MVSVVNNFSDIALSVQTLYEENERLSKENKRLGNRVNKLLKKINILRTKTKQNTNMTEIEPFSKTMETNWSVVSREIQEK